MRISGIGYINDNGVIQLHENVFEGLSIFNGAIIFGIYYPLSKDEKKTAPFKHDIMLTPFPYKLWPKSARLIIRLRRQSEGIKYICQELT
ncbi:MAG: hypothetical protein AAGI38_23490, partial [Bacteroidota bacterium]